MNASDRSKTKPSTASTFRSSPDAAGRSDRGATPTSLYVHVPFCIRRCAYCDFATAVYDDASADAYLKRLALEIDRVPPKSPLKTVYFGGGTPTSLTVRQLEFLLETVVSRLSEVNAGIAGGTLEEWTCEANPESLTLEKARLLRSAGIDRVSLGAQSFDPAVLTALGREHAPHHVFRALELLRAAGFARLSLDLMFAAPGESDAQLERDLSTLTSLDLEHVSAYCLTYEPGTPLTRMRAEGRVMPQTDDVELVQYRLVRERLAAAGLAHYEISNYARPGRESRHNLVYWRGEEYYGVGLGAGSYESGTRRTNTRQLNEYLGDLARWGSDASGAPARFPPHEAETLDLVAKSREALILGLRLIAGVDLRHHEQRFGLSIASLYPEGEVESLIRNDLLETSGGWLRLTARGLELADEAFIALV